MRPALTASTALLASLASLWGGTLPAWADAALVIANGDYRTLPDLSRGARAAAVTDGIRDLGFDVTVAGDADSRAQAGAVASFMEDMPDADRLLVVLSGRFATDGDRSWLLPVDARSPALFSMGGALSVESILEVLARTPSRAVLLLGVDEAAEGAFDPFISEGLGQIDVPQGVTVLVTTPREAAAFLDDELSLPAADLAALVNANGAVRAEGYLPAGFAFMPDTAPAPAPLPAPAPAPELDLSFAREAELWRRAAALDTLEAYRGYLEAYPRGRFVAEAQEAIAVILAEPNREARLAEEALNLSRAARRDVQEALAILDFNPRGIDGIFGDGTRRAISNWQQQNGYPQTGYLDAEQAARLDAQAARAEALAAAEAERQRQAALAAEDALWRDLRDGGEAGLRAYLERYPQGRYAAEARESLDLIEEERLLEAAQAERRAWDAAREANTARAYQDYIQAFPQGAFLEEATERRDALLEGTVGGEALEAAQARESALGLNTLTTRVIEERLEAVGFDPGAVDGRLDADARAAIRAYQRDRGLRPALGYLDQDTLVRLLADALGRALSD